jgi:hypothetical protein
MEEGRGVICLRFRTALPFGQREIQKAGVTSDCGLAAIHLGRDRSDMSPCRGQSLKNDIFM